MKAKAKANAKARGQKWVDPDKLLVGEADGVLWEQERMAAKFVGLSDELKQSEYARQKAVACAARRKWKRSKLRAKVAVALGAMGGGCCIGPQTRDR